MAPHGPLPYSQESANCKVQWVRRCQFTPLRPTPLRFNFRSVLPYTSLSSKVGSFLQVFMQKVTSFSHHSSVLLCRAYCLLIQVIILTLFVRMEFMCFMLLWTNCTSSTLEALPLPCRAIGDQSLLSCLAWLACGGARATSNVLCKQSKCSVSCATALSLKIFCVHISFFWNSFAYCERIVF